MMYSRIRKLKKSIFILIVLGLLLYLPLNIKAATSYHAYSGGVSQGTVRYVSQSTSTASANGWGAYANIAGGECGYASQSMAFSYVGKNVSPEYLCKGEYAERKWETGYTYLYGISGISNVSGSGNQSGSTAVNHVNSMLNNHMNDNGSGKYSPVIIHYHSSSAMHAIIIIGKNSDGSYQTLDPNKGMQVVRLTLSSTGAVGGSVTYGSYGCSLDAVQQYYNPNGKTSTHNPVGNVDSATASTGKITVSGWTFDQDVPKTAIGVHVYVGGPAGSSGAEGHAFTANKSRPDVAKAYSSLNIGNNHGFAETFTTKKTGTQTLYFYAINAGGGTTNPQIGTKTVTIPKDTEKPKISNVKVTNITLKGYTVTCDVSDNVGVTQVKFPTWTAFSAASSEQDDLKWHIGSISNGKASYTVKTSEHNNEVDINYVTHIYAYDAAGNSSSYTLAGRYIPGFTESEKLAFKPVATGTYGQSRYEVYDKSLIWTDAKALCEKKGGHLVTISSKEENDTVLNLAKKGSKNYYAIGAESVNTLANWRWVTKEAFSYKNWDLQATEGNTKGEPYAFIISRQNPPNKQSGEWVDGPNRCVLNNYYHYQNSGFICEYTIINKPANTQAPAKQDSSTQNKVNNTQNKTTNTQNKTTTPSNGSSSGNTVITKVANPMKIKVKVKTYKQSKLTKKRSFMIGVAGAQGRVTFIRNRAAKKANIKVSGKGKVIIPRKCKKGLYIIKVKAAGNEYFMSCTKNVKIRIK